MNRRTFFFLGLSGLAGCRRVSERRLNVFNWSSYVAPDTVPGFEREFGIQVRYAVYESNEEMLARVMSGNSGWDVVFPTNYFIGPMRELGLLQPLDHAHLPNLKHLDTRFARPDWDRDLQSCVPYMWNGTGIAARRDLLPSQWSDLWSNRYQGRMTMLDDPVDVFAACLKKLHRSLNTQNEADLRAAQQQAIAQKPLLRAYLNAEVRDQLVSGDVLAAQLWSTTAQQAIDASPDHLGFVYPQEGFALYADNAVILRESTRAEIAHQFVNYLLRPEVAAEISQAVKTATANGTAQNLLSAELRQSATLYPPPDVFERGEWAATSTPVIQRLRDRLWTEVKSA